MRVVTLLATIAIAWAVPRGAACGPAPTPVVLAAPAPLPVAAPFVHPSVQRGDWEGETREARRPGLLVWVLFFLEQIFFFLFFSFWGWIILLLIFVPLVQKRLRTWERHRRFYRARQAELANPHNADARFQLGVIHYDGRQLRRALRYFREAVEIGEAHGSEVDPLLYRYLGHTLRRLGHHREALVAYEAGLEEAPESGRGEAETGVALAHQRLGDVEAAERWYRRAATANQSLLEPRLRLAALLLRQGRGPEAGATIEDARSIRLPPFMRRQQRRWRLALLLWPLTRPLL